MTSELEPWASALALNPETAASLERIAGELKITPAALLGKMTEHLIYIDRHLRTHGLGEIGPSTQMLAGEAADRAARNSIDAIGLKVQPTGFMWPMGKPFPWTAEECKAAVLGYAVKWPGSLDDVFTTLRGKWETSDGYAMLCQS